MVTVAYGASFERTSKKIRDGRITASVIGNRGYLTATFIGSPPDLLFMGRDRRCQWEELFGARSPGIR